MITIAQNKCTRGRAEPPSSLSSLAAQAIAQHAVRDCNIHGARSQHVLGRSTVLVDLVHDLQQDEDAALSRRRDDFCAQQPRVRIRVRTPSFHACHNADGKKRNTKQNARTRFATAERARSLHES